MRYLVVAALTLQLAAGATRIAAQTPNRTAPPPGGNGEVHGVVISSAAQTPLTRAAVAVHSAADSTLVAGDFAGTDGVFRIRGLRPGSYYLRINSIGFTPKRQAFAITPAAPSVCPK